MKLIKRYYLIGLIVFLLTMLASCGTTSEDAEQVQEDPQQTSEELEEPSSDPSKRVGENPIVTITMEDDQEIIIELYPNIASNTVNNFVSLVNDGFYDGLIFHRVIPDFMIQGGDPDGTGMGGPGYAIKGEFASNGFENNLKHDRGVVSMARSGDPNSAGSQFFIVVNETEHLDGDYAAFGEVIEGMEVVDEIVSVETDGSDKPLEDQRMKEVTVDTKGEEFPEPEKE